MRPRPAPRRPTQQRGSYRVREASVGDTTVTLYATSPTGPWASRPADLAAWQARHELGCRGEASVTIEGKPLEAAARGRQRALRGRTGRRRRRWG